MLHILDAGPVLLKPVLALKEAGRAAYDDREYSAFASILHGGTASKG
jgi:hypothetical protein